jgi:hypothetical protein
VFNIQVTSKIKETPIAKTASMLLGIDSKSGWSSIGGIHIVVMLIKPLSDHSCPVNGGIVILWGQSHGSQNNAPHPETNKKKFYNKTMGSHLIANYGKLPNCSTLYLQYLSGLFALLCGKQVHH